MQNTSPGPVTNEDLWNLLVLINQRLERIEAAGAGTPAGTPAGMDETDYLMHTPANRAHLLQALEEVQAGTFRRVLTIEAAEALAEAAESVAV